MMFSVVSSYLSDGEIVVIQFVKEGSDLQIAYNVDWRFVERGCADLIRMI